MWRHMALQFDESSNKINFYLDGALALSDESPAKAIRETDQVTPGGFDTALMLGHSDPGYRCGIVLKYVTSFSMVYFC